MPALQKYLNKENSHSTRQPPFQISHKSFVAQGGYFSPNFSFHKILIDWFNLSAMNGHLLLARLCFRTRDTAEDEPNDFRFQRADILMGREKLEEKIKIVTNAFNTGKKSSGGRALWSKGEKAVWEGDTDVKDTKMASKQISGRRVF